MSRTCAVIISAYKASPFIEDCLDSFQKQLPLSDWKYDLRIGVDGCAETAGTLDKLGQSYYWSEENVGPYLIRNSLIESDPVDCYAIFDADDIMLPSYLQTLIPPAMPNGIAGGSRKDLIKTRVDSIRKDFFCGVCVISHSAWNDLGGFRPWRVTGDSDMIRRAKVLKIPIHVEKKVLFYRRRHPGSLTTVKSTGMGSKFRNNLKEQSKQLVLAGKLVADLDTVPLIKRG